MYQFVHVECYSRSAPKTAQTANKRSGKTSTKSTGKNVKYVVDEATRSPGNHPHIDTPAPPTYLHGEPLETLEQACNDWAASLKDGRGHAMRKDALCLVAGVVSAPSDISPEAWDKFQADAMEWLKTKYGGTLRTVVAHHDESHPHLHFYVVPELGQRFETIHEGKLAAAQGKAAGLAKGEQNTAYKAAMRGFQDDFFNVVGIENGMARIGPGKRRLTREEWKLEQIQAAAAAHAMAVARVAVEQSAEQSNAMIEAAEAAVGLSAAQSAELIATAQLEALASAKQSEKLIAAAKSEALEVAAQALIEADKVERAAEARGRKTGWQAALNAFEQLPWFKRVRAVIGRAVTQRDHLQVRVERLEKKTLSMGERITLLFTAGKAHRDELLQVKPQLEATRDENGLLRKKADQAEILRKQNEALVESLGEAKGRIQHLDATVEALTAPEAPKTSDLPHEKQLEIEETVLD